MSRYSIVDGKKVCRDCEKLLPIKEFCFYPSTNYYKGKPYHFTRYISYCRRCWSDRHLKYQKENKEKVSAYHKKWRHKKLSLVN